MNQNEYKLLCIKLIEKLKQITIGLVHHTEKPKIEPEKKIFYIKEIADSLIGGLEKDTIFSGVSFMDTLETEILDILLDKLSKTL